MIAVIMRCLLHLRMNLKVSQRCKTRSLTAIIDAIGRPPALL
jgi:hypothetical protein